MQEFHRLSVVRVSNESVLVHDQVAGRIEGQDNGLGARSAVEAEYGAITVIELAVRTIEVDAVQDDTGIFELEDECREWTCARGDSGSLQDRCGGGWSLGCDGSVCNADAGARTRVADRTGTCRCINRDGSGRCCHLAGCQVEDHAWSGATFRS